MSQAKLSQQSYENKTNPQKKKLNKKKIMQKHTDV
jgi:hypothetical protein